MCSDLPNTKEFLSVHNTVPCAINRADGSVLKESMPMCFWADAAFPNINPLCPPGDAGIEAVKALVAKFTSGAFDVTTPLYQTLMATTDEARAAAAQKLFASYAELAREVTASGGPYLMGSKFSIADIAVYPFVERAVVLLPRFCKVQIPHNDELKAFHAWYAACRARPSVAISSADRLPRSMETNPFASTKREDYLLETGEMIIHGVKEIVRKQLRHAPPGKKTADIPAAIEEKKRLDAEKAAAAPAAK